jgi:hypothetical protein
MGAKMIPMMRSVGRTVLGVRMGCQAFSRCCLKAVSMKSRHAGWKVSKMSNDVLAGRFQLPFSFLGSSSEGAEAC